MTDAGPPPTEAGDFYRTLVDNAAEGMLTIDEESRIVFANPAVEEILGYEPDELVGSSKMKIIPERLQPVHAAALASYVESGERHVDWDGIELPALHKEGHEVPTLISLREQEHDGERYFTGIIRDISERRRRETQLQNQKERLDQFADILTHDIRNPLSVAQGYTEIAREDHDSPALEKVDGALDRIEDLVDEVLELSKAGEFIGETERVVVADAVEDAWENVDTGEASLSIAAGTRSVMADESRFRVLLENLIRNSIHHGGEGVTVSVGPLAENEGIYVEDDGSGIPESIRSEVFDHGYTTGDGGTGYGLSIVAQIVTAHDWAIAVTEAANGGARFEVAWDPLDA